MADNVTVTNKKTTFDADSNADLPIRTSETAGGAQIQHVRIDLGSGAAESLASGGLPTFAQALALRLDEGATYTYIGEALPGVVNADAAWRVKRMTNADSTIVWADGDAEFDNVWDDRATLTYS